MKNNFAYVENAMDFMFNYTLELLVSLAVLRVRFGPQF